MYLYMYSKSKVLVATVTLATLYTFFASDVAKSCKTTVLSKTVPKCTSIPQPATTV